MIQIAYLSMRQVIEGKKTIYKPCTAAVVDVIAISMTNSVVGMDIPLLLLSGIGMSLFALMVFF